MSVGRAAAELLTAWQSAFPNSFDVSDIEGQQVREKWLHSFKGRERSSLAAPGLTRHGQAYAIDFQIMQAGKIIAGANRSEVESVWRTQGWEHKLNDSMDAAGPSFSGPLKSPDEPWHYDCEPADPV